MMHLSWHILREVSFETSFASYIGSSMRNIRVFAYIVRFSCVKYLTKSHHFDSRRWTKVTRTFWHQSRLHYLLTCLVEGTQTLAVNMEQSAWTFRRISGALPSRWRLRCFLRKLYCQHLSRTIPKMQLSHSRSKSTSLCVWSLLRSFMLSLLLMSFFCIVQYLRDHPANTIGEQLVALKKRYRQ